MMKSNYTLQALQDLAVSTCNQIADLTQSIHSLQLQHESTILVLRRMLESRNHEPADLLPGGTTSPPTTSPNEPADPLDLESDEYVDLGTHLIDVMRKYGISETKLLVDTVFSEEKIYQSGNQQVGVSGNHEPADHAKPTKADFLEFLIDQTNILFSTIPPDSYVDGLRTLLNVTLESEP